MRIRVLGYAALSRLQEGVQGISKETSSCAEGNAPHHGADMLPFSLRSLRSINPYRAEDFSHKADPRRLAYYQRINMRLPCTTQRIWQAICQYVTHYYHKRTTAGESSGRPLRKTPVLEPRMHRQDVAFAMQALSFFFLILLLANETIRSA